MKISMTNETLADRLSISLSSLEQKLIELNMKNSLTDMPSEFSIANRLARKNERKKEYSWRQEAINFIEDVYKDDNKFLCEKLEYKLNKYHKALESHDATDRAKYLFDITHKDFSNFWAKHKINQELAILFLQKIIKKPKLYSTARTWFFNIEEIKPMLKVAKMENKLKIQEPAKIKMKI